MAAKMDANLYRAAVAANISSLSVMESDLLQQVSPQKNTIVHIAAGLGHYEVIEHVSQRCPSLLYNPNSHDDTPLHVAARGGQVRIVQFLTNKYCHFSKDLEKLDAEFDDAEPKLRLRNIEGNTPLHEAMQSISTLKRKRKEATVYGYEEVAKTLVKADSGLSYLRNKEGSSPAYLAAEVGLLQLLEFMLNLLHERSDVKQWEGGKTPLHSAIFKSNLAKKKEIMQLVLKLKPELIKVGDSKGTTPFHYVAFKGDVDGAYELLKMDTSVVYQSDTFGYFPIHIAAHMGHVDIIKLFIKHCPGSWELRTVEEKENALHVAVKSGNENVIRYILKTRKLEKLLNEKDKAGNTPLHLATMDWLYKFVNILANDGRVDLSLTNNAKLTALDIAETKARNEVSTFKKATTMIALYNVDAPRALNHRHIMEVSEQSKSDFQWRPEEYYNNFIDTLLVVSSLVLTITFAAGFTMPGGFSSDSIDKGMSVFLRKSLFEVFVIFDTTAMYLSVIVVISLIWARTGTVKLANTATNISLVFLGISLTMMSLTMMSVAFTAGICLVTSGLSWLSNLVVVLSFIFLTFMGALFLASIIPIWSGIGVNMMMYNYNLRKLWSAKTGGGKCSLFGLRKTYLSRDGS